MTQQIWHHTSRHWHWQHCSALVYIHTYGHRLTRIENRNIIQAQWFISWRTIRQNLHFQVFSYKYSGGHPINWHNCLMHRDNAAQSQYIHSVQIRTKMILHCAKLCCIIYCTVLSCVILHSAGLCCVKTVILHCAALHCSAVLCCAVLCCNLNCMCMSFDR